MPVQKHRDIGDLDPPPASDSPTENIRAACEFAQLCWRLRPWQVPPRRAPAPRR